MLVVMMMSGTWGCHRLGCHWVLRHVYREYNTVADKLAGDCILNPATAGFSPIWSLQ